MDLVVRTDESLPMLGVADRVVSPSSGVEVSFGVWELILFGMWMGVMA
jgi:hypothetical protein